MRVAMLFITPPSATYGASLVTFMAHTSTGTTCKCTCRRVVLYLYNVDGSQTAQTLPLVVRFYQVFSNLPTLKPSPLILHGQFLTRPKKMPTAGITSTRFNDRQEHYGMYA